MNLSALQAMVACNVNYQINGGTSPLYIQGKPGIGKSQIIKELCKKNGWGLLVKYVSNYGVEGYTGIPCMNDMSSNGVAVTSRPAILDSCLSELVYTPIDYIENVTPTIMLLDDIHLAQVYIQQYLFELLLERKIGNHRLSNNVFLVLAGNRATDKALAKEFPAPVANRVQYIQMELDAPLWIDYAENIGIRGDIISFVRNDNKVLDNEPLEGRAWSSPRSMVQLSNMLTVMELANMDIATKRESIIGMIGDVIGNEFISYYEMFSKYNFSQLSTIDTKQVIDILVNDIKESKLNSYIICSALTYWFKQNETKLDFVCDVLVGIATTDNSISSNIPLMISGLTPIYKHSCLVELVTKLNGTLLFDRMFEILSA